MLQKKQSAYALWCFDNRDEIAQGLGFCRACDVGKKCGEIWKSLSDAAKSVYHQKACKHNEAFQKFAASEEGQTAVAKKKLLNSMAVSGLGMSKTYQKQGRESIRGREMWKTLS